jgi:hypothetical protein
VFFCLVPKNICNSSSLSRLTQVSRSLQPSYLVVFAKIPPKKTLVYLFDAPHRGAKIAELCRSSGPPGTNRKNDCISVAIESRHLFEYMQKLGLVPSIKPCPDPFKETILFSLSGFANAFLLWVGFSVNCHLIHQGLKLVSHRFFYPFFETASSICISKKRKS